MSVFILKRISLLTYFANVSFLEYSRDRTTSSSCLCYIAGAADIFIRFLNIKAIPLSAIRSLSFNRNTKSDRNKTLRHVR